MNSDWNPLEPVWNAYLVSKDSLRIAHRTARPNFSFLLSNTQFIGVPRSEANERIRQSRNELEDLFIVSLWASFERFVIDYVIDRARSLTQMEPRIFSENLYNRIETAVEYWRSDDILDMFKPIVDQNLIGLAKQIHDYRNWVAHKNWRRASPAKTDPGRAFDVLSEIIRQIQAL